MIELKLNTGEDVSLTPIRKDDKVELLTSLGDVVLQLYLEDNSLKYENKGSVIEEDGSLHNKLEMLSKILLEQDFAGIETDVDENQENDPFNPEDISIDTKTISMDTLLRRLEQQTIKLNPDFQRNEVWSDERKSQLIESLILRIPIPMFYVSSDEKSKWTVVDGLQRISTIRDFVLGKKYLSNTIDFEKDKGNGLKLRGLEFWKDLNNCSLNELPIHLKNRVLETEFTFTIINPGTPEEVKRNIFKRLNTGGMPLSSQEIRNALYIGASTVLLNKLAKLTVFKEATGWSIHTERMEDRELVLRFIAFYLRDYSKYAKTLSIDTWLSDTMIILNALPDLSTRELNKSIIAGTLIKDSINIVDLEAIQEDFITAMQRAKTLFGPHAFRKSYGDLRRSPINKSLFETWSVILCKLSCEEYQSLLNNKDLFWADYQPLLDDWDFIIEISRDSMKHGAVKSRFNKLNNIVQKHI